MVHDSHQCTRRFDYTASQRTLQWYVLGDSIKLPLKILSFIGHFDPTIAHVTDNVLSGKEMSNAIKELNEKLLPYGRKIVQDDTSGFVPG